jgi:hypothetical protein
MGKPKGKRPLGKIRRRLEDNIKVDPRGTGWDGMTKNREQWRNLVYIVMNIRAL